MTHKRVILADDLEPVLATVSELVSGSFDIMSTVSDGKSALELILELQPDIAVLDISMPGLSGLEVARELKRRAMNTKIVILTVHEDSGIIAACLSEGASGYVLKELMESDLLFAMNEALAGRVFISRLSSA